jgi:putative membrane-bound dehydrogenase-like protein
VVLLLPSLLGALTAACLFAGAPPTDHTRLDAYVDESGQTKPIKTPQDWSNRRAQILEGMQQAMGPLPDRSYLPPPDVKVTGETKGDGFTRLTLTYLSEGADRVPADLYLPASAGKGKHPAIVALHQTNPRGRRDLGGGGPNPNMAYAPELARRGYVVLCPDYPSFGDYPYDFNKDQYVSGSMKGVFNHMRAVDLLCARDDVDPDRIGAVGHSLGGHNALFLAAFDERIKAVVTSCGWTPFADYYGGNLKGWTSDRYMPRLRDAYGLDPKQVPFDFQEVIAAIAPRWLFSNSPLHDDNFSADGVKKAVAAAQPAFDLLGVSKHMKVVQPDCAHDFPPEVRQQAFAFLDEALASKSAASEPDYSAELPRIPPKDPAEAMKTFQVLPGFRIEQVAAEPLVRDPIAMSFNENGRLFVVEMCDYSEQDKDFLGQIRMLEDTDGDGQFDKSTIYADKLSWPTALICYDGGIFVGAAPDIYYLKDTDGDGKADVRKTVFTGFNRSNVQGLINSFTWTLDNRIHGATSLSGGHVRCADDPSAPVLNLSGRDFSFDPKTLEMRPESGGAQHGLSFDDWGRKFVCSNSDHIQAVMFEDRYLGRNPYLAAPSPRVSIALDGPQAKVFRTSPVEPWRIVRTRLRVAGLATGPVEGGGQPAGYFTGATGTTIYRGDAFPEPYRGQAFVGDVGSNIVHRKVLEPDGVGFVARRADEGREFVASTDTWFRPCQFANAPDGTLYVADMYREVIEHPASLPPEIKKHLDLTSGRDKGRIYRVVPDGYKQRPTPKLGAMNTAQLVAALEHRNGWHRDTAARLLYERADPAAREPLEKLANESKRPEARMHALYALAGLKALTPAVVLGRLADENPRVREHAVRLSESLQPVPAEVVEKIVALSADPDVRVRYQVAFTAGFLPAEARKQVVTETLKRDGSDKWLRLAAMTSVGSDPASALAALIADSDWCRSPAAAGTARELARQIGARPDSVKGVIPALESLAAADSPLLEPVLLGIGYDTPGGANALRDSVPPRGKLAAWLGARVERAGSKKDATHWLALDAFDHARPVFEALLDNRQPDDVQLAALQALDRHDAPGVGEVIVKAWPVLTPKLRKAATDVLLSRPARAASFVDALASGKLPMAQVDAARLRQFAQSLPDDGPLKPSLQKLLSQQSTGRRDDVVARYRPALQLKGDPVHGKAIFTATCAPCHRLEGVGHEIGPNLAAMANRGAEAVLVNVLDPNREVTPQYVDYVIETTDGRTLNGMLAAETATSITLKRAEDASDTVLRAQIKRMRSGQVSIMPEGLEQQLDVQGMADLISYMMGAK